MIQTEQLGRLHRWEFDFTFQKCVIDTLEKWADLYKWANVGKFWVPVICLAKSLKKALCGRKGFMPKSLLMEKPRRRPQNFQLKIHPGWIWECKAVCFAGPTKDVSDEWWRHGGGGGSMRAFPAFHCGDLNNLSWVSFPATYYWYQLANRQIWGASLADFLRLRSTKKDMGCLDACYCNY